MRIRQREESDRPAVEDFLARWNALRAARGGVLERPLDHPALIAEENGDHGIPLRDELELEPPVVAETGPRPLRGAADGRP